MKPKTVFQGSAWPCSTLKQGLQLWPILASALAGCSLSGTA